MLTAYVRLGITFKIWTIEERLRVRYGAAFVWLRKRIMCVA